MTLISITPSQTPVDIPAALSPNIQVIDRAKARALILSLYNDPRILNAFCHNAPKALLQMTATIEDAPDPMRRKYIDYVSVELYQRPYEALSPFEQWIIESYCRYETPLQIVPQLCDDLLKEMATYRYFEEKTPEAIVRNLSHDYYEDNERAFMVRCLEFRASCTAKLVRQRPEWKINTLDPEQIPNYQIYEKYQLGYYDYLELRKNLLTNKHNIRQSDLLHFLYMSEYLLFIPPEIKYLSAIVQLQLSELHLSTLPPELFTLTTLVSLSLDKNNLTAISPEIKYLVNLQRLYLNYNDLRTLPSEIADLPNLKKLDVSSNPNLKVIPPGILSMPSLQVISTCSDKEDD